jgi:hypothetical protein
MKDLSKEQIELDDQFLIKQFASSVSNAFQ